MVTEGSDSAVPQSRREFVADPAKGESTLRAALHHRASRCGLGIALTIAVFLVVLWIKALS